MNNKKPKLSKYNIATAKRLLKYVTETYKARFILVFVCIFLSAVASISVSLSLKYMLDDFILPLIGQKSPDYTEFYRALAVLGCIFIVGVIATFIYTRMMVYIGQGVLKRVRDDMFEHMQTLPIRYFDQNTNGSIMSLYTNDTDTLRQMISQAIPQALMSFFTIIVTFISMLVLSPLLTLLAIVVIGILVFVTKKIGGNSGKYFVRQQVSLADVTGFVEEHMNGQRVVKVFNHEQKSKEEFDQLNEALFDSASQANKYANMMGPVIGNIGNLQFVLTAVLGGVLSVAGVGGITLGVGMIVDNSIVVLENIFSYRADGYSRWDACTKGTGEVMTSVTASTLTTIAVFLPIALSGGMTGMMFKEFCITIVALLLSSLIIALTLVPLLCYILLGASKVSKAASAGSDELKATTIVEKPLMRRYRSSLKFLITHRWAGIAITLAICVLSVISIAMAGMELIPEMDQGQVSVSVSMPNGSTMEDTAAIQDRIAGIVMDKVPETEQIYYSTGDSTSIMSSASGASVTVSLVDLDKRDRSAQEITKQLRRDLADIAGCEITVSASESMSMSTDSDISVELTGDDYDQLAATADDLVEKLSAIPDAINVESSAGEQTPRVAVKVRRENASRFGLTPAAIGGLVRGELTGSTATTLRMNGEEYDVTVSGDADVATSLDALRSMQLPTATGGNVPLSSVADVYTELSPQSIVRKNQKETVTITGESESGDANAITEKVNEVLDSYETPDGVEIGDGDTMASQMAETTGSLMLALAVAIALVYFILATQFNSFALPIAIMLILPIGLLGSMMLLAPTGNHVSMVALLGVIILAGTVVNSSIVLIDYTLQRRERGEDKNTAILNACPRRVRPVLMTAMTTILGLVPMVFSNGEGSEMMKPMGIVMMTGMVISTVATLFITPVYYSLTDSIAERLKNLVHLPHRKGGKGRKSGGSGENTEENPASAE